MQNTLNQLTSLLPAIPDLLSIGKVIIIAGVILIAICFLFKLLFGKESLLNKSICAAIGILFIYAVTIVIYTLNPVGLTKFITPLPYVVFSGDRLFLFAFEGTRASVICSQLLSMVILAYLYNIIEDFMPRGKGLHWLLYRVLTVAMAMALHLVVTWLMNTFLPSAVVTYAPTILLVILIVTILLGVLKVILGLVLAVVNPIIGAIYGFFFATKAGTQLTRAVVTTALLSALVMILNHMGCTVISVAAQTLITYIPLIPALLLLWYLLGTIL